MTREEAIEILETDKALTGRQLHTYYGIHPKLLTGLGRRDATLGPKHGWTARPITVRFYGVNQSDLDRLRVTDLGHFAGTGELRYQLQADTESWRVLSRARVQKGGRGRQLEPACVPDAEYDGPDGRVGVEYDTGTYTKKLVAEKLRTYEKQYDRIVWGTLSGIRQARLKSKTIDWRIEVDFRDATWWEH